MPVASPGKVAIVDAVDAARERLADLFVRAGFDCVGFSDAAAFLAECPGDEPACAVLGFDLADSSGLALQQTMASERTATPVIFHTAGQSLEPVIQAMKAGALDVLKWPCEDHVMLAAVERGLTRSRALLADSERLRTLSDRHASLTAREKAVLCMVAAGLLNKQIAFSLALSEITVKAHRGRMMRKMKASSIADLVIMADRLGLDLSHPLSRRA